MTDDLSKKLQEMVQPELDRQQAEHRRFMELMFVNATDEQKKILMDRAREQALGANSSPKRKLPIGALIFLLTVAILTALIFGAIH